MLATQSLCDYEVKNGPGGVVEVERYIIQVVYIRRYMNEWCFAK